jgi:hypothetical protein
MAKSAPMAGSGGVSEREACAMRSLPIALCELPLELSDSEGAQTLNILFCVKPMTADAPARRWQ